MTWEFGQNCVATKPSPSPVDNSCTAHHATTPTGWGGWTAQSQTGFAPANILVDGELMGQGVQSLVDLWLPVPKMYGWIYGLTDEENSGQTITCNGAGKPLMSLLGYLSGQPTTFSKPRPPRETSCKETPWQTDTLYPDKSSRQHLIPKCFTGGVPLGKLQDDSLRRSGFNPHLSVEWNYVRYILTYFWTCICNYILYMLHVCIWIMLYICEASKYNHV